MCDANTLKIPAAAGFQSLHRSAWYRRLQVWALSEGDASYDAGVEKNKKATHRPTARRGRRSSGAGFSLVELAHLRIPIPMPVLRPHIVGTATK